MNFKAFYQHILNYEKFYKLKILKLVVLSNISSIYHNTLFNKLSLSFKKKLNLYLQFLTYLYLYIII